MAEVCCRAMNTSGWNSAIPVAPSAASSRHSRSTMGSARGISRHTNGANTTSETNQRRNVSTTGSMSSRSIRPTTKLPAQNKAASANARVGERMAEPRPVPLPPDVGECAATVMIGLRLRSGYSRMVRPPAPQSFDSRLIYP